jgi:hypothetical protein
MPKNLDPHNIAARLSKQNHLLLEDLEKQIDISFRERLAALGVIAKIEKDIRELQKEANELDTGTAVRRYAKAFEVKVITVGKFSVVDIFDANRYAHDPRNDFLNWSFVDTGTFDYAADSWGYTYGAAAEWYRGNWTLRAALFDLSIVPNSTELDPTFRQFQMVYEIEHRHELWGEPGKIALDGFLSRGRMGSYDDAPIGRQSAIRKTG